MRTVGATISTAMVMMRPRRLRISRFFVVMRSQVGSQAADGRCVRAAALGRFGSSLGQRGLGSGHDGSPSRLVTDKNQSSSDVWISRRP